MSDIIKFKCVNCGKIPEKGWLYMPGSEDNFYCDDCVPRGCSCNNRLKDGISFDDIRAENPENYYQRVDELGRKYPCCEFFWVENIFEHKQEIEGEWETEEETEAERIEREMEVFKK